MASLLLIGVGFCVALSCCALLYNKPYAVSLKWLSPYSSKCAALFAPLLSFVGSHFYARRRSQELARQIPDAFRSLAAALGSGKTLSQAVGLVGASGSGALYQEFARTSLVIACGTSASEALQELPERICAPGIELMVMALSISARTGAPLQGLFARASTFAEKRFELERELRAKTAQVRLSARLVSGIPIAMLVLLALISSDFRKGLTTPAGIVCVAVAAILDALALLIMHHLMKGVI